MKTKKLNPVMMVFIVLLVFLLGFIIFRGLRPEQGGQDTQNDTSIQESDVTETETETETESETVTESETDPTPPTETMDGIETFVIFGVDSRTNQLDKDTHSDSIMVVRVNHDTGTVKVASIYRDCMVYIQGKGYEKITHAHCYGGPKLALSTVNENFDLHAENYVTVNFNTMIELVDSLGGVEIELTDAEAAVMNSDRITGAGTYLLNGKEALTFSRIRYIDTDFKRTERQREVLFKIFEKTKPLSYKEKLKMAEGLLDNINTSYNEDEILILLYSLSKYEIEEMTAFPEVFYAGDIYGWVEIPWSLVDMNAALHKFLYGTTDYVPSQTVQNHSDYLCQLVDGPTHDKRK
jgi:LCP family protein required for cell wall assembly